MTNTDKITIDDMLGLEVEINDQKYSIEEGVDGWSYYRHNQPDDLDDDSVGGFATHIDALQAAMLHEETRDETLKEVEEEIKEHNRNVVFWQWKCR